MLPYIKEYGPLRRRLRIKNKFRLVLFLIVILLTLLTIIIPRGASQVNYKPYKVGYGDTYWGIAKDLQQNGYKSNEDIRCIVDELIRVSGISASDLKAGDIIYIPETEGVE